MCGIYKITNKLNNKCYIGKSSDINKRWQTHRYEYKGKREYNKLLYAAFRKYGLENFTFEVLEEFNKDDYEKFANNREQYWIMYYNSYENGYNATLGGDGGRIENAVKKQRRFSKEEVEIIRELYAQGELCLSEAYELYKDRITKRGFQAIWLGQNYKEIKPEVFTEENKKKHNQIERQRQADLRKGKHRI